MKERVPQSENREEGERAERFVKMQEEEQKMGGGILRRINEAPAAVRKGVMMLAAAGSLLAATEFLSPKTAEAGDRYHRDRQQDYYGYQYRGRAEVGWDKIIVGGVISGVISGMTQGAVQEQYRRQEDERRRDHELEVRREVIMREHIIREERNRRNFEYFQEVESRYRQEELQILRAPNPTAEKEQALRDLDRWRNDAFRQIR